MLSHHVREWIVRRRRAGAGSEAGFTLLETVLAIGLLAIVVTALTGLLAAAVGAQKIAREKTLGEQIAMDQIETIRRIPYDNVGIPNGNPPGTLAPTQSVTKTGLVGTIATTVRYVSDPAPTSYTVAGNYKKVVVTVTRNRDSKVLASDVTYVAPPGRAAYGGINNAVVSANVIDYANSSPVPGSTVSLLTGPSATRTDTTDNAGNVTFPTLTANPNSSGYYDLSVTPPAGYVDLSDDVSPSGAAHVSLSPGQTFNTTLRVFKPATINLAVNNSTGTPYSGTAVVTVTSSRQTQTFSVTGGTMAVTSLNGEVVVPSLQYTVSAKTPTPLCADPPSKYVPDTYPTVLTTSFIATLITCPSGMLNVTVKRSNGSLIGANASVSAIGGPNAIVTPIVSLTNSSSVATLTLPIGSGYTIKAYSCSLADASKSKTQTAVSIASGTNTLTLTLNSATCPP